MITPPPPPPTSEMFQEELDREGVKCLLEDLVRIIAIATPRGSESAVPIRLAFSMLLDGTTRGVRVSYRHEGADWVDTLVAVADGRIRLVRVRT